MAPRRDPARQPQPRPRPGTPVDTLTGTVETDGHTTVIRLVGSLRCATAPVLRESLDAVLEQRPDTVILDLAEVTADDELGLWVLPAMAGDTAHRGIKLLIAAPTRALRVRLRRLGGHHLDITDLPPARSGVGHARGPTPTVPAAPPPAPSRRSTTWDAIAPIPDSW